MKWAGGIIFICHLIFQRHSLNIPKKKDMIFIISFSYYYLE